MDKRTPSAAIYNARLSSLERSAAGKVAEKDKPDHLTRAQIRQNHNHGVDFRSVWQIFFMADISAEWTLIDARKGQPAVCIPTK